MDDIRETIRSTSDGWRAIIGQGFTFDNVSMVTAAVFGWLERTVRTPKVFVGYDTRFMGEIYGRFVASQLRRMGAQVILSSGPIPTPLVSWFLKERQFDLGLTVTASHNPYFYNGIKIRLPYGGPPGKEVMQSIEHLLGRNSGDRAHLEIRSIQNDFHQKDIIDPVPYYISRMSSIFAPSLRNARLRIAVDAMHGTTAGLLRRILASTSIEIIDVRTTVDPLFEGAGPEPKATTLQPLLDAVSTYHCDFGVAHDGDGDRLVAVAPEIGCISSHDLLLVLGQFLGQKRMPGSVVASVSTSRRVERLAGLLHRNFIEVPVGFHNASQVMREQDVLIAGEENGGLGFGHHLPERDASYAALMLIDCVASAGRSLASLVHEINDQVGPTCFMRRDIAFYGSVERLREWANSDCLESAILTRFGVRVTRRSSVDGTKLSFDNDGWLLIRPAGTEPVVRVYTESPSPRFCELVLDFMQRAIAEIPN